MEKSNCCNAPIKVISSGEGTSYLQCTKCLEGCDIAQTNYECKHCNDTGWINGLERCSCVRHWDRQ